MYVGNNNTVMPSPHNGPFASTYFPLAISLLLLSSCHLLYQSYRRIVVSSYQGGQYSSMSIPHGMAYEDMHVCMYVRSLSLASLTC